MYFVDLYNGNDRIVHAPFEKKDAAIKYFNFLSDRKSPFLVDYNRVEIFDENVCLFDCEV